MLQVETQEVDEERFKTWLRQQPCVICQTPKDITVSHIKTKGSGGQVLNNCLPMCMKCHIRFENQSAHDKQAWLTFGKKYTERFYAVG